jgi:hypothetical protein
MHGATIKIYNEGCSKILQQSNSSSAEEFLDVGRETRPVLWKVRHLLNLQTLMYHWLLLKRNKERKCKRTLSCLFHL